MRVLLLILCISFTTNAWAACSPMPSCGDLNYTDTTCKGAFLTCPFDTTKKKCLDCPTCPAQPQCPVCEEQKPCEKFDCSAYSLKSCPPEAKSCTACGNGLDVGYKISECQEGYQLSGNSCSASSCAGYLLTYCPTGATCLTCKTGTKTKYKVNGCQSSYVQNGQSCYNCAQNKTYLDGTSKYNSSASMHYYAACYATGKVATCGDVWFAPNSIAPFCQVEGINCLSSLSSTTGGCCQSTRCQQIKTEYEAAVSKHNSLCPNHKVTREYSFNCYGYIPQQRGSQAPMASMCPNSEAESCPGGGSGESDLRVPSL